MASSVSCIDRSRCAIRTFLTRKIVLKNPLGHIGFDPLRPGQMEEEMSQTSVKKGYAVSAFPVCYAVLKL
jgi:hypothetical protein